MRILRDWIARRLYAMGVKIETKAKELSVDDQYAEPFGEPMPNVPNPTWQGKSIPHEGSVE